MRHNRIFRELACVRVASPLSNCHAGRPQTGKLRGRRNTRGNEDSTMSTTIYSGPVFEMARRQFESVADYLAIPSDERARLLYPKRAITVSCPIHRDNGKTEVFQ